MSSPLSQTSGIVAQVVAFERLHDADTRRDHYTIFLSDGTACDEDDLATRAQPVALNPDLNQLIEEELIKLYSIVQLNQYIVHQQDADIGPHCKLITPKK